MAIFDHIFCVIEEAATAISEEEEMGSRLFGKGIEIPKTMGSYQDKVLIPAN